MPLYDLPPFYPCSDGKWRTYDKIVDEAAHAQYQARPTASHSQHRLQDKGSRSQGIGYGQRRKREERE